GKLPSNVVTAIAMDFDNRLWIGTDSGFGILYSPENAFTAGAGNYNVQRPKIDVNGEVDYILGSLYITDIEVDGGNRKWIATVNSGMILLSADGLTVIKHFTTENSPLISNSIMDLEIDQNTGEIFIVTDRGLMSYRGDASYENEKYDDVKIFPNPARPDFDGLITIQGIRYDSDIKVTDVAGNVVYKTTSNGGTATWNGKNFNGEKVASGVYMFWTASNIHKGRYVGKVVVVN
ncbi:MAG TPA: two-component regulator propeller domain-containing protein, partial [Taishania sp.]|nr:two-component regulator propeller domain-containing protein [Taishania sp.]